MKLSRIKEGPLRIHYNESVKRLGLGFLHPGLFLIDSDLIAGSNGFVLITITKAALERLNIEEKFAVVDHELGHTKRWKEDFILDLYLILPLAFIILVLSCAVLILIFKSILSSGFVKSIFLLGAITCLFLFLIVRFLKVDYIMTIKRQSEFGADEVSAKLGNAQTLISVLEKRDKLDKKDRFKEILFVFYFSKNPYPTIFERKKELEKYL